jgi:DNA-binding XRE family transcriptional regulator
MSTFTLKVTLEGIRPPIWRRFVVPAGISLAQLHRVLQIVMGWTDSHLHQFERGRVIYGLPDPDFGGEHEDERRARLDAVLERKADWMTYEYDFGDSWTHRVVLEKIEEADAARSAVIVAGKRACPPEDCGGVGGYARVVSAAQDPDHPEHQEVREWLGGEFDPAAFDLVAINTALRRVPLRELQLRAPRRRSPIERVLAGPEEPSPTFRAKLKTKLEDPAAILTDREGRYLASQVELALATIPESTRAVVPPAEDIVRWSAVAARCRQVREERGWATKDAANALKVARYKIDAVEKGPVRGYELEVAVRYFRLLGLEPWIARWTRSNPDLARRQGLGR